MTLSGWCGPARLAALAVLVLTQAAACTFTSEVESVAAPPTPVPTVAAPEPTATAVPTSTPEPTATPAPPTPTPPPPAPTPSPTPTPPASSEDLSAALAASQLIDLACPAGLDVDGITCHLARVPLRAHDPDPDEVVDLFVTVVDNGDPLGIGPVVYLQGGPGIGSVTAAPRFVGDPRDVIFVDQRGTGFSEPKLSCPEVDDLWVRLHTAGPDRLAPSDPEVFAAYESCADRLRAEGIDLNEFNTEAAADDIALLRQLLGYESWSLWGISYGTRLGLSILRDHPEGVSAAVLDSVVPFEVDFFASVPVNAARSFEALDAVCDASACATDHGDFLTNLAEQAARLDADPLSVTITRPVSGETYEHRVDGAALLGIAFTQLYSTALLTSLPRQVARLEFGGVDELVTGFAQRRDPEVLDLSIGLYYSTWCREEFPFHDTDVHDEAVEAGVDRFGRGFGPALSSEGVAQLCELFAVEPATPLEDRPIDSDVPTLVMAGSLDPITPPSWSAMVADSLSDARYVELADHGHGMATSCPVGIQLDFLADPGADLDTACADETGDPALD